MFKIFKTKADLVKENLQLKQEILTLKTKTYEEVEKHGHVYVIKTDGGIKIGKTYSTVKKRLKGLQTGNVNDIDILLDYNTSNADLLEKTVHYVLSKYRCKTKREFFECDQEYIKMVVEVIGNTIDTFKSSYQNISKEELINKLHILQEENEYPNKKRKIR